MAKTQSSGQSTANVEWLTSRLDEIVKSYTQPQERRIGYGNLRYECATWTRSSEVITNIAIIYETPGGSTAQINITYDHHKAQFSYIDDKRDETVDTNDAELVVDVIEKHIKRIPIRRLNQLQQQIDTWVGEGKTRSQLFGELNKLLQTEFLGGRINTTELKQGIQYAITHYAAGPSS